MKPVIPVLVILSLTTSTGETVLRRYDLEAGKTHVLVDRVVDAYNAYATTHNNYVESLAGREDNVVDLANVRLKQDLREKLEWLQTTSKRLADQSKKTLRLSKGLP